MAYHHLEQTFGRAVKIGPFTATTQTEGAVWPAATILVDAALGDDSPWNPGTTTPLKTLAEVLKRLPISLVGANGYVTVQFAAGDYTIPSTGLEADFAGSVNFVGAWGAPTATFTVDSYSGDDCHVHQPAGNPAWTVDEWAGYWVEVPWPGYPDYPSRAPILANGTHDLTIGIPSANPWGPGSVGTVAKILKPSVRFLGGGTISILSGSLYVDSVMFDKDPGGSWSFFYQLNPSTLQFGNCHFRCANSGGAAGYASSPGAITYVYNCFIENGYSVFYAYDSVVEFDGVSLLNSLRLVEGRQCLAFNWNAVNARNSNDIFFLHYRSWAVDRGGLYQMINMMGGGWEGTVWFLNYTDAMLLAGGKALDGKTPGKWVDLNGFGRCRLQGTWADTIDPTKAIAIRGPAGTVWMSIADLIGPYGGDYDYGYGLGVTKA